MADANGEEKKKAPSVLPMSPLFNLRRIRVRQKEQQIGDELISLP